MSFCRSVFQIFRMQRCKTLLSLTPGGCHWWKCYRNCLLPQRGHLVRYLPQCASRCLQGKGCGHFRPLGQGPRFHLHSPPLAGCFVHSFLFSSKPSTIQATCQELAGDVPLKVINDGEVTALAAVQKIHAGNVMGISMGSSEGAGALGSREFLSCR